MKQRLTVMTGTAAASMTGFTRSMSKSKLQRKAKENKRSHKLFIHDSLMFILPLSARSHLVDLGYNRCTFASRWVGCCSDHVRESCIFTRSFRL